MLPKALRTGAALPGAAAATCAVLGAALLFAAPAHAEGHPGSGRPHRPPPPEALAACEKKAAGAACSFQHDGHDLAGACWAPEGKPLACKPDRPPPHQDGPDGDGPPR